MQATSDLYKELLGNPFTEKEIKLEIAGVTYNMPDIVSVSTSGGIFTKPDIGGASARQIDLVIYPRGTIPRQAEIKVFARLVLGGRFSEWIQKGVYFISTRKKDRRTGTLTIHGFDAMLKANVVWLTTSYPEGYLPKTQRQAVENIAMRMNVSIDPRTVLPDDFPVMYEEAGNESLTMMDILCYIAVANAGNWIMTDKGELLLLRYGKMFAPKPETNYLVTEYGEPITFGGDRILVG